MKNVMLSILTFALFGCHETDGAFILEEFEDTTVEETPRYWLVAEAAIIPRWKVETDDFRPDPWAALYRLGDQIGTTASCDMDAYNPKWEDHITARTVVEWLSDSYSIVLYDYELEPSGNSWLGSCAVDITAAEIEHELSVTLEDCKGAVQEIVIRLELYDGPIDHESEKNPNC